MSGVDLERTALRKGGSSYEWCEVTEAPFPRFADRRRHLRGGRNPLVVGQVINERYRQDVTEKAGEKRTSRVITSRRGEAGMRDGSTRCA